MKLSYKDYNFDDSLRMMDSVLSAPSDVIRDSDSIPSKDMLNASNAYFVYYTVVHIRLLSVTASMESNQEAYFKVNKVALGEFIALCRSYQQCEDVDICNQTVTVVLNTRYKKDIDDVKIVVLYNAASVNKNKCPDILKNIGVHVAMKSYNVYRDKYLYDYEQVRKAIEE